MTAVAATGGMRAVFMHRARGWLTPARRRAVSGMFAVTLIAVASVRF